MKGIEDLSSYGMHKFYRWGFEFFRIYLYSKIHFFSVASCFYKADHHSASGIFLSIGNQAVTCAADMPVYHQRGIPLLLQFATS